jgi:lipopolysaccharide heptosyltransferase III
MAYRFSSRTIRAARAFERAVYLLGWPLARRDRKLSSTRRILLIEPFQMGDVLSLCVMLEPLRQRFAEAELIIWCDARNEQTFAADGRVSRIITSTFPWSARASKRGTLQAWVRLVRRLFEIRRLDCDIGIDTRGEVRSQALLYLAGCRRRIGRNSYLDSNMTIRGLLVTDNPAHNGPGHRFLANLSLLQPLIGEVPTLVLPAFRADGVQPVRLSPHASYQVIVHIGGGWEFKRWPELRWIALLRQLTARGDAMIVVVGGTGERDLVGRIEQSLPAGARRELTAFRITTFPELIGLTMGSDLFVGLDSGPMNLATLLGIRTVALFGPGDELCWYPIGDGDVTIHHTSDLRCHPCFQRGCVIPEHSCMSRISVAEVAAAIDRALPTAVVDVRAQDGRTW